MYCMWVSHYVPKTNNILTDLFFPAALFMQYFFARKEGDLDNVVIWLALVRF